MHEALRRALARALDCAVERAVPATGGDVSESYRVRTASGRELFVKTHRQAPAGLFGCEARGLAWLAQGRALRVPAVVAVSDDSPAFLALEHIASARPAADHDERLGRGLATLHRAGAPVFGLDHDNYIAVLPQENRACATWAGFYAARRLEPHLARAVDAGRADARLRRSFARLFSRLATDPEDLCGPPEPPARVHGDLWSGNAIVDERGAPCLIDPAVYGGHREVDLAMMRLFGGFGPRCFTAYHEAYPLAPDHERRVSLYQLHPLLVHANLFGGGYADRVQGLLDRLV